MNAVRPPCLHSLIFLGGPQRRSGTGTPKQVGIFGILLYVETGRMEKARSRICTLYSLRNDPEFNAIRAGLARRVDELRKR